MIFLSIDGVTNKVTGRTSMSSAEYTKPVLDESFYEPNIFMSIVFIGYGLTMFSVFGWLTKSPSATGI